MYGQYWKKEFGIKFQVLTIYILPMFLLGSLDLSFLHFRVKENSSAEVYSLASFSTVSWTPFLTDSLITSYDHMRLSYISHLFSSLTQSLQRCHTAAVI